MEKIKIYFLFTILGLSGIVYGQKNKSPTAPQYIVERDSLKYLQGEFTFNPKYPQVVNFRQFKDFRFEQMNAFELVEFGFYNGWVYRSENINGKHVFLRKLVSGTFELLHLKNVSGSTGFLLDNQSDLIKLNRKSFRAVLKDQLDGEENLEAVVKSTNYNANSLARTFLYYSTKSKYFPKFRFGAQFGLVNKKLSLYLEDEKIGFSPVTNISIAVFANIPIGVLTPFSARIETITNESSHTKYDGNEVIEYDYLVKFRTTTLPILLRYRFSQNELIDFYFEAGISYAWIKETFDSKKITVSSNPIEASYSPMNIPSNLYGGILGFGGEYSLNFERYIGLEFRYEIANSMDEIKMNTNSFQLLTSINF